MENSEKLRALLERGARVKIIGDSLAAGEGCSTCRSTGEIIFEDDGMAFDRRMAPGSWWGLLEAHLLIHYPGCSVKNLGCSGMFTYQAVRHLDRLLSPEDQVVFVLMGTNDRKRPQGLAECRENVGLVLERLLAEGKEPVLMTPNPSTYENEHGPTRIYHTEDIVRVLRELAREKGVVLVDLYRDILDHAQKTGKSMEELMVQFDCKSDGLHPPDRVQKLMFASVINTLGI